MNDRLHAVYLIGKKDFFETIHSLGIYLTMTLSFGLAAIIFYIFASQIKDSVLVMSRPVDFIFMFCVVGISFLYLAVSSVTSIAKEKGDKTIEVLFYGPVDEISFIFGKYAARILSYIFILLFSILFILFSDFFVHLGIPYDFVKLVILSIFLISCIIALGIFLSTLTSSVGGSIVLLIGFFVILFVIGIISWILSIIPIGMDTTIDLIRNIVVGILNAAKYVSPLEYLGIGWDAISSEDNGKYILSILYSGAYSLVFLMASVIILIKRGAKQ